MSAASSTFGLGVAAWRERWISLRNRLVASPRFQDWVSSSSLTRRMADKRARALFDICAGFAYSQTLVACVKLNVFDILRRGAMSTDSLADQLALSPNAVRCLMRAAASLGLVRILPGERYALADLGASMLANPSVAAFVEHHALLYDDLRDPVALLRGAEDTQLARFWPYAVNRPGRDASSALTPQQEESVSAYSRLMSQSQAMIAAVVLDAYPIAEHKKLLDIGGGEGAFIAATAARAPHLRLALFDLPAVADRARNCLDSLGLAERVEITGGSFLDDSLPTGADLISLIRIVHDHDDESALCLLRAIRAALAPGGTILIAEPMAPKAGTDPVCEAYFGFYLLAMGRGRTRPVNEHKEMLRAAGFSDMRVISTRQPMLATVITARHV